MLEVTAYRHQLVNAISQKALITVHRFLMYQEDQLLDAGPRKFLNFVSKPVNTPFEYDIILLHSPTGLTGDFGKICTIFSIKFVQNFCNSSFIATMNGDSFTLPCTYATLSMINIDLFTVRTALAQLCDYAAGSDGLPAMFFK